MQQTTEEALRTKMIDLLLANAMKCIFQASHSRDQFHCIRQSQVTDDSGDQLNNMLVSAITIAGADFNIQLGICWQTENMKILISEGINRKVTDVNFSVATGFMGELCNAIAGAIKADIAVHDIKLKLGLPEHQGQFDSEKWEWDLLWEMCVQKGGVYCFFNIDNWNSPELGKLLSTQAMETQDEGEIEFL